MKTKLNVAKKILLAHLVEGDIAKDPEIGIRWPLPEGMTREDLIISGKDQRWPGFAAYREAQKRS